MEPVVVIAQAVERGTPDARVAVAKQRLKVSEGAAYGAALQALWCWRRQQGEKLSISDLTDEFVEINRPETAEPDPKNVEVYRELQALQDDTSLALREVSPLSGFGARSFSHCAHSTS